MTIEFSDLWDSTAACFVRLHRVEERAQCASEKISSKGGEREIEVSQS